MSFSLWIKICHICLLVIYLFIHFFSYEFDFCNLVLLLTLSYFYQYLNWPFEMIVFAKSSLISN